MNGSISFFVLDFFHFRNLPHTELLHLIYNICLIGKNRPLYFVVWLEVICGCEAGWRRLV